MNEQLHKEEGSKIIRANFKRRREDRENEVTFPASKNFPREFRPEVPQTDDPLWDVYNEFGTETEIVEIEDSPKLRTKNYSYQDDVSELTEKLLDKTRTIKLNLRKMKYFLDEAGID